MNIIEPSFEIINPVPNEESRKAILHQIATAARNCYQSNGVDDSKMVRSIIARNHTSPLEFSDMTVRFTIDRGVANELTRHRICSFCQESTRYCNYANGKFGNEITVIKPAFAMESEFEAWKESCEEAERKYMKILETSSTEFARDVLPISLKTVLLMKTNMAEWRHIFKLRAVGTTGKPHPQMLQVMVPLLKYCKEWVPELFEDLVV